MDDDLGDKLLSPRALKALALWMGITTGVALVGALGYMLIEGWSFFDGLYMAVTILSSVGLKELRPMNRAGDLWTLVMAGCSVLVIFGTVGIAAETIASELALGDRKGRRMQKRIDGLHGHYIVCGYGRVGSLVARELAADGKQVVVVDAGEESRGRAEADGFLVVDGNGASDATLAQAGISRAAGFVTAIDSDADNVYATISARALNPELFIVARASTRDVMHKLTLAGADRAISPYVMAGRRAVQLVTRPGVVDFLDAAMSRQGLSFSMEEVEVSARLAGLTVGELRRRGLSTMAVQHDGQDYETNPPDERVLLLGESLIVSGSTEALATVVA